MYMYIVSSLFQSIFEPRQERPEATTHLGLIHMSFWLLQGFTKMSSSVFNMFQLQLEFPLVVKFVFCCIFLFVQLIQ